MKSLPWMIVPGFLFASAVALADSKPAAVTNFSDQSKAIIVNRDHPDFAIVLKSNPTTGYRWVLRHYNRHLLRLVGEKYYAPNTGQMGAPGYVTFSFHARKHAFIASQKTNVMLEYVRPWEANASNTQQATFTVVTTH